MQDTRKLDRDNDRRNLFPNSPRQNDSPIQGGWVGICFQILDAVACQASYMPRVWSGVRTCSPFGCTCMSSFLLPLPLFRLFHPCVTGSPTSLPPPGASSRLYG